MHGCCSYEHDVPYQSSHHSIFITDLSCKIAKSCMTAFNSVSSVGHLLWGLGEIHVRVSPHRSFNSSAVHGSSIFPSSTPAPSAVIPPNNLFATSSIYLRWMERHHHYRSTMHQNCKTLCHLHHQKSSTRYSPPPHQLCCKEDPTQYCSRT